MRLNNEQWQAFQKRDEMRREAESAIMKQDDASSGQQQERRLAGRGMEGAIPLGLGDGDHNITVEAQRRRLDDSGMNGGMRKLLSSPLLSSPLLSSPRRVSAVTVLRSHIYLTRWLYRGRRWTILYHLRSPQ